MTVHRSAAPHALSCTSLQMKAVLVSFALLVALTSGEKMTESTFAVSTPFCASSSASDTEHQLLCDCRAGPLCLGSVCCPVCGPTFPLTPFVSLLAPSDSRVAWCRFDALLFV
jgi:hypothetical protein